MKIRKSGLSSIIFFIAIQLFILDLILYLANRYYNGKIVWLQSHLFQQIDPPELPWYKTGNIEPLWGEHYFGDLPHVIAFTTFSNPWNTPFSGQPLSLNLTSILGLFGPEYSLAIFFTLNALAMFTLVQVWGKGESLWFKTILLALCFPLNISTIYALDRGNLVMITVCCIGIAIGRMYRNRQFDVLSTLFLICAVSLKVYVIFIILLLALIYKNEWRFFVKGIAWLVGINLFLFLTYPGAPVSNTVQMIRNFVEFTEPEFIDYIVPQGGSLLYLLNLFQSEILGLNIATSNLLLVATCIWMLMVGWICSQKTVPTWLKLFLTMSTFQMATPGAPYVMTWNIVGILLLSARLKVAQSQIDKSFIEKVLGLVAWAAVLTCFIPHDARFWLSPILLTSLIVITFVCFRLLTLKRIEIEHEEFV